MGIAVKESGAESVKVYLQLHNSPLLIANIVKGTVSRLRPFLATESPWKLMKNAFCSQVT